MTDKELRVTVNPDLCVGSTTCVGLAPEHFRMTDEGVAAPIEKVTSPHVALEDAEESCPVQAIRLQDGGSDERTPR